MPKLFSTLNLGSISLKNRIIMSPMCQYSAQDGFANEWHYVHYGSRAVGGVAAIIQEATAVSPQGRITYHDLGLWKDEHMLELNNIVNFIHKQKVLTGIQLSHAGRKGGTSIPWMADKELKEGYTTWKTVGPSSIAFENNSEPPHELSLDEIKIIINDFKESTERSVKIGYDIIELHAAHGYLIHQFLSPLSNTRTDEYGGSFENRIRLLLDIIKVVQNIIPNYVSLWVRISATDWIEGGWTLEESIKLSKILKTYNVDVMDVSSGGIVPHVKIPVKANYQVPFAHRIKNDAEITTGTVGLITQAIQAEEILENKEADLIIIGRELLRNPYFPREAAAILGEDFNYPPQYERA